MKPLSASLHLALVTAKFGVTALIALLLATWLVPKDVLSAAFVALLCIQPSLVSGVKAGIEQLLASGLGAVSTIGYLLFLPNMPVTSALSIATTYAVATYMRMGYPALVVALFSSLYMTLLAQDTLAHTALLRFQSVLLGVVVAIAVNAIFSPISTQVNLAVRITRSVATVRDRLSALRAALVTHDAAALGAQLGAFQDTFRALGQVKDELADLRREFRLPGRPGRRSFGEVYFSDRCLRELELATHHAQDVAMASVRLLREQPDDGALVARAAEAVQQALDMLDMVQAGRFDRAEDLSMEARADLHALTADSTDAERAPGGYSPRLVLAFALIQLHGHLAELLQAAAWLDQARRDPDQAMKLASSDASGGHHATEW